MHHAAEGEGGGGGGGDRALFGEAPPQGPFPYPFIYHFWQKRPDTPFVYLLLTNGTPFIYLV